MCSVILFECWFDCNESTKKEKSDENSERIEIREDSATIVNQRSTNMDSIFPFNELSETCKLHDVIQF